MLSQVYILQLPLQSQDLLDSLCEKKSQFKVCPFSPFLDCFWERYTNYYYEYEKCAFDFLHAARHLLLGSLRIQSHTSVPFERRLIEIVKH